MRLGKTLSASTFGIGAPPGNDAVRARVIGVVENQAPTRTMSFELPTEAGCRPRAKSARSLVEGHRHREVTNGFVPGFGYQGSMVASTVAHGNHHMIVVGTDRDMMAAAANGLANGGEVTVWRNAPNSSGRTVAGLMSDRPAHEVWTSARAMVDAMAAYGCSLQHPLQHSLLALMVIPELRISDWGWSTSPGSRSPTCSKKTPEPAAETVRAAGK